MSDEIQQLLIKVETTTGTEKVDVINELAWQLRHSEVQRAYSLFEQSYQLSTMGEFESQPYDRGQISSLAGLAYVSRVSGKIDSALKYLLQARNLSEATGLLQPLVNVHLAAIYNLLGNRIECIETYEKGLTTARQTDDQHNEIQALIGIANAHTQYGNYSKAIEYLKQSLELCIKTNNLRGQILSSNNLASVYNYAEDYDNAQIVIENILPLTEGQDFIYERILATGTKGEIVFTAGNNELALSLLQQALMLCENHHIIEPKPQVLVAISKIYREQQQIELESKVLGSVAKNLLKKIKPKEIQGVVWI